ncbi:hypothetical protein [Streptomyces sennicomposti]
METDHIVLIIVAVFAIAGLLLMFLRAFVHDLDSFMRDLFKVIDTWHELRDKWSHARTEDRPEKTPDD